MHLLLHIHQAKHAVRRGKVGVHFNHLPQLLDCRVISAGQVAVQRLRHVNQQRQRVAFDGQLRVFESFVVPAQVGKKDRIPMVRLGIVGIQGQRLDELTLSAGKIPIIKKSKPAQRRMGFTELGIEFQRAADRLFCFVTMRHIVVTIT